MERLYILKCKEDKWYVGKSTNVAKRYQEHCQGNASEWTRQYAPLEIAETRLITSPFDETTVTKELMKKYGIDNVRGGAYTSLSLSDESEQFIRHELRSAYDTCYLCGKPEHFAKNCPETTETVYECEFCHKEFESYQVATHHEIRCKFRKIALNARRDKLASGNGSKTQTPTCFRCGYFGHYANECYARRDVHGNFLE
jgi:predicted GIY-YIG superfamily endonuclease